MKQLWKNKVRRLYFTLPHFETYCKTTIRDVLVDLVYHTRHQSSFIFLAPLKRLSFLHPTASVALLKICCPYMHGSVSVLSIKFWWSMRLSLCQEQTVLIIAVWFCCWTLFCSTDLCIYPLAIEYWPDYCSFTVSLDISRSVSPPGFLLQNVLTTLVSFLLHVNFRNRLVTIQQKLFAWVLLEFH